MANEFDRAKGPRVWRGSAFGWAFANIEEIIGGAGLLVIVGATSWGVFTRYLTQQPVTWTSEVATIAFAWTVFVGASAALKHGGHVSIDMLVTFFPDWLRAPLQTAVDVVVVIFCVVVAVLATMFSIANWDSPTSVLRVPVSTSYLAVSAGFGLMALRHGHATWARCRSPAAES